jgi:hypothetical protein
MRSRMPLLSYPITIIAEIKIQFFKHPLEMNQASHNMGSGAGGQEQL